MVKPIPHKIIERPRASKLDPTGLFVPTYLIKTKRINIPLKAKKIKKDVLDSTGKTIFSKGDKVLSLHILPNLTGANPREILESLKLLESKFFEFKQAGYKGLMGDTSTTALANYVVKMGGQIIKQRKLSNAESLLALTSGKIFKTKNEKPTHAYRLAIPFT